MSRSRGRAVVSALLLAAGAPISGAEVEEPSPGSIALLVIAPSFGPAELSLCRRALASPRPEVRAAAARVARVRAAGGVVAELAAAVAAETDAAAAREELLALGTLADASADAALFAAASRFAGRLDAALAQSIGLRGRSALAEFEKLAALELDAGEWTTFFRWATRGDPEALAAAVDKSLAHANAAAWSALLDFGTPSVPPAPDASLARAALSDEPRIREATYYYLLERKGRKDSLGPETKAALALAPEASSPPGDKAAALAFELLERSLGRAPRDASALLRELDRDALLRVPTGQALLATLVRGEREAFAGRRFGDKEWFSRRKPGKETPTRADRDQPDGRRIRTASDFPPGVVSDLLRVTGCELPSEPSAWNALEAQFAADAVKRVGFFPMQGPAECERAVKVLLLMSVVPDDRPPLVGQTHLVVLPMDTGFTACVDSSSSERPRPAADTPSGPSIVREPRKTKNVVPRYPPSARNQRRSGIVYLEAVIGPTGCIRSTEVLSAPHVDLAGEALRAVTQWRYTPTLLNGQPVPVIMTVTVNFRLN